MTERVSDERLRDIAGDDPKTAVVDYDDYIGMARELERARTVVEAALQLYVAFEMVDYLEGPDDDYDGFALRQRKAVQAFRAAYDAPTEDAS